MRVARLSRWSFLVLASVLCTWRAAQADQWQLPAFLPPQAVRVAEPNSPGLDYSPFLTRSIPTIGVTAMRSKYPYITGRGQTVAIIDTGLDYTHPALASRYLTGYDFADHDGNPMDDNPATFGHGTHVAGIVASTDATYGGVAPGVRLISLKVFPTGGTSASDEDILSALNWVADNASTYHITAVNISLGGDEEWTDANVNPLWPHEQAFARLKSMGVFVACASGNSGYLNGVSYPAASPNVVSVGGTWSSDDWSPWMFIWKDPCDWLGNPNCRMSDWAPRKDDIMVIANRYWSPTGVKPDLLAPGAIITSSIPLAFDTDDGNQDGWTDYLGTSMATPHVAGAAVLVRQALEMSGKLDPDPNLQVDQILSILQSTGVGLGDYFRYWGGNNSNIVDVPDANGADVWYIRPSTWTVYPRIDLDAAIRSIDPVPEPATFWMVAMGTMCLLRRRRGRLSDHVPPWKRRSPGDPHRPPPPRPPVRPPGNLKRTAPAADN